MNGPSGREESLKKAARDRIGRLPRLDSSVVFAGTLVGIFLLHWPLLRLPYFWDEAGYYVPAARDILLHGSLIPHTTVSNAHPPLVLLWLAAWWKIVGYAPVVTRAAMLVLAAFSLTGVFRLARNLASVQVAVAATLLTALYPVFFAQSSLAQVDLAAAGLTFWGLSAYFERRIALSACWFAAASLAKETAILTPLALVAWELFDWISQTIAVSSLRSKTSRLRGPETTNWRHGALLLASALPLTLWYLYHYSRTGHVFGNPEFFRYNVASTLTPLRFFLAALLRLWQAWAYLHLWTLTLTALLAIYLLPPRTNEGLTQPAIAVPAQQALHAIIATYVIAMSLIGGAVLARYMLPAVPLVIILCVSTLWRRMPYWRVAIICIALAFVLGWFWNPPYGFSPEDNLAYRDYVTLHEKAESFLEARYPMDRVLTAWPASDELTRPWLGYVTRPMRVARIEDFSLDQMIAAVGLHPNSVGPNYDVALVFSTKYDPGPRLWDRWLYFTRLRNQWKHRFFGFHRDLPPVAAARILGGRIVFSEERHGQWIAVIAIERVEEAKLKFRDDPAVHLLDASFGAGPGAVLSIRAW